MVDEKPANQEASDALPKEFPAARFFALPHYLLYTRLCTGELNAIRKQKCFICSPFYGRACRLAMLGEFKP